MARGMTVAELMRLLEQQPEDAIVLIAYQPSWPLQMHVRDVHEFKVDRTFRPVECDTEFEGEDMEEYEPTPEVETQDVVYLVGSEGMGYEGHPYAPREVFER